MPHAAKVQTRPVDRVQSLAARQHGVVTTNQAMRLGMAQADLYTRVRRGEYRRLWRGVIFVKAGAEGTTPWLARVHGALLRHGAFAKVGLGTAARLLGAAGHDTDDSQIQLILPSGCARKSTSGISLHYWDVPASSTVLVDGIRCTDAITTVADLIPRLSRNPAVATLDSALHRQLITPADLPTAKHMAAQRPGAAVASSWWSLTDRRAASPLETWARLDCVDHDLAPDQLQWEVRNSYGNLLGIGDMAWLNRRRPLVGEADGAEPHSTPQALFRDRSRANSFVSEGIDIVRFTWADARRRGRCAGIVRQALATEPEDLRRRQRL